MVRSKKIKKKIFGILFTFFISLVLFSQVDAAGLKFMAGVTKSGKYKYARFRTYVKSYKDSSNSYHDVDWTTESIKNQHKYRASYARTGITFSRTALCTYKSGSGKPKIAYDTKKTITKATDELNTTTGLKNIKSQARTFKPKLISYNGVKKKSNYSSIPKMEFPIGNGWNKTKYRKNDGGKIGNKWSVRNYAGARIKISSNFYISVDDWLVPKEVLDKLVDDYNKNNGDKKSVLTKVNLNGKDYYKCYFSFHMFTRWNGYNKKLKATTYKNAYAAIHMPDFDYWDSQDWGLSSSMYSDNPSTVKAGSILNSYDNILYFPVSIGDGDNDGRRWFKTSKSRILVRIN